MLMGKLEERQRLTVVRKLLGHDSIGPSGVLDQSIERISSPISPPPTSQLFCRGIFGSEAPTTFTFILIKAGKAGNLTDRMIRNISVLKSKIYFMNESWNLSETRIFG